MAEWWTVEVFSGDKVPASAWRYSYEDALTEAAVTHGALYWLWSESQYGVVFEVCFETDEQWEAFRVLPTVRGALDAAPDPVNGLLVYRGRGGAAGSRKPRGPRPAPGAAAMELAEPVELCLVGGRTPEPAGGPTPEPPGIPRIDPPAS